MKRILITGMSGVGKSSVVEELEHRGYPAFDINTDEWCELKIDTNGNLERQWQEDKVQELLERDFDAPLFLSGCESNQGKFYPQFDYVVLLSAPPRLYSSAFSNEQTTLMVNLTKSAKKLF
jgi:broad-specificity NMP kinase